MKRLDTEFHPAMIERNATEVGGLPGITFERMCELLNGDPQPEDEDPPKDFNPPKDTSLKN